MRLVRVLVSRSWIESYVQHGSVAFRPAENALPLSAVCKNISYDPSYFGFWLIWEHESFTDIEEGQEIPELMIKYTRV